MKFHIKPKPPEPKKGEVHKGRSMIATVIHGEMALKFLNLAKEHHLRQSQLLYQMVEHCLEDLDEEVCRPSAGRSDDDAVGLA